MAVDDPDVAGPQVAQDEAKPLVEQAVGVDGNDLFEVGIGVGNVVVEWVNAELIKGLGGCKRGRNLSRAGGLVVNGGQQLAALDGDLQVDAAVEQVAFPRQGVVRRRGRHEDEVRAVFEQDLGEDLGREKLRQKLDAAFLGEDAPPVNPPALLDLDARVRLLDDPSLVGRLHVIHPVFQPVAQVLDADRGHLGDQFLAFQILGYSLFL